MANVYLSPFIHAFSFSLPSQQMSWKGALGDNVVKACLTYIPIISAVACFVLFKGQLAKWYSQKEPLQGHERAWCARILFTMTGCGVLLFPVDVIGTFIKVARRVTA